MIKKKTILVFFLFILFGCNNKTSKLSLGEIEFSCDCAAKEHSTEIKIVLHNFQLYNLNYKITSESKINKEVTLSSENYIEEIQNKNYFIRRYDSSILVREDLIINIENYTDIRISFATKCQVIFLMPKIQNGKMNFVVQYRLEGHWY